MTELPSINKMKRAGVSNALGHYAPPIVTNTLSTTGTTVYAGDTFGITTADATYWNDSQGVFLGGNQAAADPQAVQRMMRAAGIPPIAQEARVPKEKEVAAPPSSRRIVKVVVIDPDPNMPIDQCVLHSGDEKLTELDDTELFYELNITDLLKKHNDKRIQVRDKKASATTGRDVFLEPTRAKNLRMAVVEVAAF